MISCQAKNITFVIIRWKKMSISQRIKEIRKLKIMSQVQFSKQLQVSQAAVSQYENGFRSPDNTFLSKISDKFHVNLNWLLTGSGPMFQELVAIDASFLGDVIRLPIVAEIAAGAPCEAILGEPLGYVEIARRLLGYAGPYLVFRVAGESMAPQIMPGDIVVCSESWEGVETNGKVMAFRTDEGITLKRIAEDVKRKVTWLMPLNSEYVPVLYEEGDAEIVMIGILDVSIRKHNRV